MNISKIDSIINYKFKNKELLKTSLTHSSFSKTNNYQTLEFLGDRILSFVISEYLFTSFPNENEGDLSKRQTFLVCGNTLSKISKDLNLGNIIIFSKGEETSGGKDNPAILEDVLESLIGAIYLDSQEINVIKKIILDLWEPYLHKYEKPFLDPKSELQELLQTRKYPLPQYKLAKKTGTEHNPNFTLSINVTGIDKTFEATASRKKDAQKELAKNMLEYLKSN